MVKFDHKLFNQLHFDFGTTAFAIYHMPFFKAILSVCDHRELEVIHSNTNYLDFRFLIGNLWIQKYLQH